MTARLWGLCSCCAASKLPLGLFSGTLISLFFFFSFFFFFFFWKCRLEIWLWLSPPLHHRTSSQVDKTPHSFAVFFPADNFSSCHGSPLTVSQSESLYVVLGRSVFGTTICLLLLSVSLSLLLPRSRSLLSFPAKATHRRRRFFFFSVFFFLLPFKILETL